MGYHVCMYIPEVKKKKKRGKKGFAAVRIGLLIRKYPLKAKKKRFPRDVSSTHVITQTHHVWSSMRRDSHIDMSDLRDKES